MRGRPFLRNAAGFFDAHFRSRAAGRTALFDRRMSPEWPSASSGAGLSGLATAWYLTERGASVDVIDAAARPGGLLRTHQLREGLVESAARGIHVERARHRAVCRGRRRACPTLPESRRRFIFRHGRPRRWPLSPAETIARGGARRVRVGASRHGPRAGESVAAWGHRVVGPAATPWLIAPALQGIYATPPDVCRRRRSSGRRRGPGRGALIAPRGGMGELVDRLHAVLRARGVDFEFGSAVRPSIRHAPPSSAPTRRRPPRS